jgi:ankyrin repeat protein/predicted DNA-binding WGR domain protein
LFTQLLEDVVENQAEAKVLYFGRVKDNKFVAENEDSLQLKYVIQTVSETDLTLTYEEEEKKSKKKGVKKEPAQPEEQKAVKGVEISAKAYKALKAAAKKFVPAESEAEEEQESEDSEEKPTQKLNQSLRIKGIKSQKGANTQGIKKSKATQNESDEEEDQKVGKGQDGKKKAPKKPTEYKRGKWNPHVSIIEKCDQLESESVVPNFECSTRNSNREVIRAAKIGSKKLLDKIIESDYKISRLTERWGVENTTTALKIYIDNGDIDSLIHIMELLTPHMDKKSKGIKYGKDNVVYIQKIDTGYNDKYAYGVATRKVNVSRGGQMGNNAFVEEGYPPNNFDEDHQMYFLTHKKTTGKDVEKFLGFFPNFENQFISKISSIMRAGNVDVSCFLLDRAIKNDGYGITEYFKLAYTAKKVADLKDMKKINCPKKAFGLGNLTPIHCACMNPNSEILKHILELNPEYQVIDSEMRKLSHYAACCKSAEPLKYLASQNVDTRDHDNMKTTPLMYAAKAGNADVVKFLLHENRSVPAAKDRHGHCALSYAAVSGHTKVIKLLLDAGVKVTLAGPDRMTALHFAAARGDFDTVEFLIDNGAKVPVKDKYKRTPLLLACKNGNLKIASYLLQQGSPFDEGDSSGNTPLHYACAYGYPEIIDVLMKAGANANAVNSWKLSPTAVALLKSYFSCLRKMLDYPQTDVNCIDDEGRTLVSNAIKTINAQNFNHVAFLLRDKKADPNIADAQGLTAFDYLCCHNVDNLAQADIKPGMSLEEVNNIKSDKHNLYKKYFKLFLECSADINHQDKNGLTPIFHALQNANSDGFDLLLDESQLNVDIQSTRGFTVFHYAVNIVLKPDYHRMMKKLINRAGKKELMNAYNDDGYTPALAIFKKFMELLPNLRGQIFSRLTLELKQKKKQERRSTENTKLSQGMDAEGEGFEEDDEDEDEDEIGSDDGDFKRPAKRYFPQKAAKKSRWNGLKGGARVMFHAKRAWTGMATSKAAGFGQEENEQSLMAVPITQEENKKLETVADQLTDEQIDEFLDFFKLFKSKGANVDNLIKDPKKAKKETTEEENAFDEEQMDYNIDSYFQRLLEDLQQSILKKIDLPADKKPHPTVGYSLLHLACSHHNLKVIDFLLKDFELPLNQTSVYMESELLHYISTNGCTDKTLEVLEKLLARGFDLELANIYMETPLLKSIVLQKEKFVFPLIKAGANVNAQDVKGNYPLLQAIKFKNLQMVELLLKHHANPNLIDKQKRNSIHWAINLSNADADASNEIENCLLSSGGEINAVDLRGRTPLHYAFVKIGDPFNASAIDPIETVSNIIARTGVKADIRDKWGNTPLSYAAQRGSVISTLYLLKNGANIDNVNDNGNTPLNICLINGHQNEAIFLIQRNCSLKVDIKVKKPEEKQEDMLESEDENNLSNKDDFDMEKKRPRKAKRRQIKGVEEKEEVEYESSESVLDAEEKPEDEQDEEIEETKNPWGGGSSAYGRPRFGFRGEKKMAYKTSYMYGAGGFNQNMINDAPDTLKFGKKEKVCSTFSVAIRRNWQSVAFLMLEFGFDLSLAILDCFNHRKYNYVYTLLLKKADAGVYQTTNAEGQNLTHLFAQNAGRIGDDLFSKILGKLEAKQLDFGSADRSGRTSLHYAAEAGSVKLIAWLLERGLDVNKADSGNVTPLGHLLKSAFGKTVEFAELSLAYRLDLNQHFTYGMKYHTALTYIIAEDKSMDTFIKLHELGADINKGDCQGWTPLIHLIRQNREDEIRNLMKQFPQIFSKCEDIYGQNIIHHVVKPREFGSYENVVLLEYLSKFADVNHKDKSGKPPLFYAKQQASGRMEKALLKCKAKEYEIDEDFRKAGSTVLSAMQFPEATNNFEADFELFIEQCKQEADKDKDKFEERCPVDENATGNYEVCYDGEDPYDCYMVKVDISYGYYSGNTFYKMQILRERVRDVYILFTRWGRVGTSGQFQQTPYSAIEDARKEFCSIFKSKSGNPWEDRHSFVKVEKKYRLVPVRKETKVENFIKAINYKDPRIPETHLDKTIYKLIRRICNYKVINNAVKNEYRMDNSILPLQSLTKERLSDAETILKALQKSLDAYQEVRNKKDLNALTQHAEEISKLSSEFYELIPSSDFKKESIPPITNHYMLTQKRKMLNDLIHFEVAIKMLGAAMYYITAINPVDYIFNSLSFKVAPLSSNSDEYKILREFVQKGRQGASMNNFISNIYAVERKNERDGIKQWEHLGNRMLLWHGTRGENIVGIIQHGFRIAPADAQRTGAMFGEGVYFTDIFNKCFQYAQSPYGSNWAGVSKKLPKRYVFLCEVALGKCRKLLQAQNVTDLPNDEFQSVMGYGQIGPSPKGNIYMSNGCIVPLGNLTSNPKPDFAKKDEYVSLQYNEYAVYDTSQVRIRYIFELRDVDQGGFF